MSVANVIAVVAGLALGSSIAFNAFLYAHNKALTKENAELAATVEVINKARVADAEAYELRLRQEGAIHECLDEKKRQLHGLEGLDDDALLDGLRGVFVYER